MSEKIFPGREYPNRTRLSQGMSGTTWRVTHPDSPNQNLVLKEPREDDGLAEADIKREARALVALRQSNGVDVPPGVPMLVDVGRNTLGDVRFIVTEDLSTHFVPLDHPRPRPFTAREVLRIAKATLTTLDCAHRQNFTHGDLEDKPGHIWLRATNLGADASEPLTKVMDWGNAQWVAEGGTASPVDDLAAFGALLLAHWPEKSASAQPTAEIEARKLLKEMAGRCYPTTGELLELVARQLEQHERELATKVKTLKADVTANTFGEDLLWLSQADPDQPEIAALKDARDESDCLLDGWHAVARGLDALVAGATGTTDLDEAIRRAQSVPMDREQYERVRRERYAGVQRPPGLDFVEIERQARHRAVTEYKSLGHAQESSSRGLGESTAFLEAARALASHQGGPPLPDRASPAGQAIWQTVATILAAQDPARVPDAISLLLLGPPHPDLDALAAANDIPIPPPPDSRALPDAFALLLRAANLTDISHTIDRERQHLELRKGQLADARSQGTLDPASREPQLVDAAIDALTDAIVAIDSVQDDAGTGHPLATVADRIQDRYSKSRLALDKYGQHRNLIGDLQSVQAILARAHEHSGALQRAWHRGDPFAVAREARTLASLDPATARDLAIATNRAIAAARTRIHLRKASLGTSIAEDDARSLARSLRALGPAAWLEPPALDALEAAVGDGAPRSSTGGSPEARQARGWASLACIRALKDATDWKQPPPAASPTAAQTAQAAQAAQAAVNGALIRLHRALDHGRGDVQSSVAPVTVAEANAIPGAPELLTIALAIEIDQLATRILASPPRQVVDPASAERAVVRAVRDEATALRPTLAPAADLAIRMASRASALDRYLDELAKLRAEWDRLGIDLHATRATQSLDAIDVAIASVGTAVRVSGGDDGRAATRPAQNAVADARDHFEAITDAIERLMGGSRANPAVATRMSAVRELGQLGRGPVTALDAWLETDVAHRLDGALRTLARANPRIAPPEHSPGIPDPIARAIMALPSEPDHAGGGQVGPVTWFVVTWSVPVVTIIFMWLYNNTTDGWFDFDDVRAIGTYQTTVFPLLLATLALISMLSGMVAWLSRSLLAPTARALPVSLSTGIVGGGLLIVVLWPIGIGPEASPLPCPTTSTATATFVVTVRLSADQVLQELQDKKAASAAFRDSSTATATFVATYGPQAPQTHQDAKAASATTPAPNLASPPSSDGATASGTTTCEFMWQPKQARPVRVGQTIKVSAVKSAFDKGSPTKSPQLTTTVTPTIAPDKNNKESLTETPTPTLSATLPRTSTAQPTGTASPPEEPSPTPNPPGSRSR